MNYETDSTWHRTLLTQLAERMRPACYLELGLWHEPAMLQVAQYAETCYGVDSETFPEKAPDNCIIVRMTTDEFFERVTIPRPELVFVDASHDSEQVLKDLENISRICADNCIVVIHDTFPENREYTDDGYCSDSYKVPDLIPWECVTLPLPPGITICRMRPRSLV